MKILPFINIQVEDIRIKFFELYRNKQFTIIGNNKTGSKTVEIVNACFEADEPSIFGAPNEDYLKREMAWYESMSLNVDDIPGGPPKIWDMVAGKTTREINSNYGWCVLSAQNIPHKLTLNFDGAKLYKIENINDSAEVSQIKNIIASQIGETVLNHIDDEIFEAKKRGEALIGNSQFDAVLNELKRDSSSRRAIMIYTRPTMHRDYNRDEMSDFICTNTVQYFIREDELITIVSMRSNDAIFGYNNDFHWQNHITRKLFEALLTTYPTLTKGPIYWNAASLHIYERHFKYLEEQ